ncbi:hypothetical protein FGB62_28g215 [Gracilaria domingensis]|nr:hypothetical protein FGB62_28g215 [Gracilaria domingensis]
MSQLPARARVRATFFSLASRVHVASVRSSPLFCPRAAPPPRLPWLASRHALRTDVLPARRAARRAGAPARARARRRAALRAGRPRGARRAAAVARGEQHADGAHAQARASRAGLWAGGAAARHQAGHGRAAPHGGAARAVAVGVAATGFFARLRAEG